MRIKNLSLKNFGGHRALDVNLNSESVFITGSNGAGKSTLLSAIRFCLTGDTEDEMESYVFREIGEDAPTNAEAKLVFAKDGKEYTIWRRVGKTPKRRLDIEGSAPITSAAEVDKTMKQIFSADRLIISNAVFLRQGKFVDLLFGSNADREKLFMKMLMIAHLANAEAAADQQIRRLEGMLDNVEVVSDELRDQLSKLSLEVESNLQELNAMPDYSSVLTTWRNLLNVNTQLSHLNTDLSIASDNAGKQVIMMYSVLVENAQSNPPTKYGELIGYVTKVIARLQEDLSNGQAQVLNLFTAHNDAKLQVTEWDRISDMHTKGIELRKRIQSGQTDINYFEQALQTYMPNLEQLIEQKTAIFNSEKQRHDLSYKIGNSQTALSLLYESRQKISSRQSEIFAASEERASLEVLVARAKWLIELNSKAAEDKNSACCPLCGANWNRQQTFAEAAEETIRVCKSHIPETEKRLTELKSKLIAHATAQQLNDNAISKNELELKNYQRELDAIIVIPDVISDTLEELKTKVVERNEFAQKLNYAKALLVSLKETEANYFVNDALEQWHSTTAREQLVNAVISASKQMADNKANIDRLTQKLTHVQAVFGNMQKANEVMAAVQQQINTLSARKKPGGDAYIDFRIAGEPNNIQIEEHIEDLEARQKKRDEKAGEVRQMQTTLADLGQRLSRLEMQSNKQTKIRVLVEEMEIIKKMCSRGGLPAEYMKCRFEQLLPLINNQLSMQDSVLSVALDPTTPLSFLFTRSDTPSVLPLPQDKLSGGQRVRLVIAFIMAIHRLIIPEVGLCVLDEPSTHLNEDAKLGLRDMFKDMNERLQNSDAQLIVVDHEEKLSPAFKRVITL